MERWWRAIDFVITKTIPSSADPITDTWRQHIVPQFYLRGFRHDTNPKSKDARIFQFLKHSRSAGDCMINDVGYEVDFYNLPASKTARLGCPRVIEKVLSILEDRWATVIREFRDTSPFTIRKQSRLDIAFYIAVQWIRSRNLGGFVDGSGTRSLKQCGRETDRLDA